MYTSTSLIYVNPNNNTMINEVEDIKIQEVEHIDVKLIKYSILNLPTNIILEN